MGEIPVPGLLIVKLSSEKHSPILMAFTGATILNFDATPVAEIAWQDVEHVALTKAFLNDPEAYLRHL